MPKYDGLNIGELRDRGKSLELLVKRAQVARVEIEKWLKDGRYSPEYQQQQAQKLRDPILGDTEAIFEDIRAEVQEQVDRAKRKAVGKVDDLSAHYAQKTYLLTLAGQQLAGLTGRDLLDRFAALAKSQPEVAREAAQVLRTTIDSVMLPLFNAIRRTILTDEERVAERAEAQADRFLELARLYEGRTRSVITGILDGQAENPAWPVVMFDKAVTEAEAVGRPTVAQVLANIG